MPIFLRLSTLFRQILFVWGMSALGFAPTYEPVSVCEVLDHPKEFFNRSVMVAGILEGSKRHGWFLLDNAGETPCGSLARLGRDVSPLIRLEEVGEDSEIEGGPVEFQTDDESARLMFESQREAAAHPDLRAVMIVAGLLRVKGDFEVERLPNGGYIGSGYGPSGVAPAQLVVKTVLRTAMVPIGRADSQVVDWIRRAKL